MTRHSGIMGPAVRLGTLTEAFSCLLPTAPEEQNPLTNGEPGQHSLAPQKSLPDLPPPKIVSHTRPLIS